MALSLKKRREILFQLLYSRGFDNSDFEAAQSLVMRQNAIPKSSARAMMQEVEIIWGVVVGLDAEIAKRAHSYEFERIPHVERSILRLGLYELLHTDLPPKVAISEAVRLAKKYATQESASFVNGLLDGVFKDVE